MSDTTAGLRRKIGGAGDLQSVVRTMKAVAASSIGQYEQSVSALAGYYRTVELGLSACFRENGPAPLVAEPKGKTEAGAIGAVVFGSDQGLVGQFNDVVADYAVKTLAALPAKAKVWAVGERVHERLAGAGLPPMGLFAVPNSVKAIPRLVGRILVESEARQSGGEIAELHLFYNRPTSGAVYEPVSQRLLPLDEVWRRELAALPWPTKNLPEVIGGGTATLREFWPLCNAPTRTSTNYWKTSTGHFIVCARMGSTRSCSTWSPALRRWWERGSNLDARATWMRPPRRLRRFECVPHPTNAAGCQSIDTRQGLCIASATDS